MVFDVPAENGGALTILNDFYQETLSCIDKQINWFFVVSKPLLEEKENIKVLRFPWIKRSWVHRLYFDHIIAPTLVKRYNVDKVFSLQNVVVPNIDKYQILYLHQSLPFVDYKFKLSENIKFWVYQNLISRSIIKSLKKADKVIVQTNWMKRACQESADVVNEKIYVIPPEVHLECKDFYEPNQELILTFFYPASALTYKNHKIIVKACKALLYLNIKNFKVIFTLTGNESKYIRDLYEEVKIMGLPIEFVGSLTRDQVFQMYTKSILLFPSYIETYGLPLIEAKMHRGIILASDSSFSHEILDNYENAYFFDPFTSDDLVHLMRSILNGKIMYNNININNEQRFNSDKLINQILKQV